MGGADQENTRRSFAPLLAVRGLDVKFVTAPHDHPVAPGLEFEIGVEETVGLTGPSGAGKTTTALALIGLRPDGGPASVEGSIRLRGRELVGLDQHAWREIRGKEIALIPQNPGASLTPVRRIDSLLGEVAGAHGGDEARTAAIDLLAEVGFDDPSSIARRFPHELSGGMQQQVAIAAALAGEPMLLLADEPTSSLDVVAGQRIMEVLRAVQRRRSMSMLLISHDRRILARHADRVLELRGGGISPAPPHARPAPRTRWPNTEADSSSAGPPVLELRDVEVTFGPVRAVDGLSLSIWPGDSLGLVGPTGGGKSTLARCAARLLEPTAGSVAINGHDVTHLSRRRLRGLRGSIGMVFQNPAASLNPTRRVEAAIEAPLRALRISSGRERSRLVQQAADSAQVDRNLLHRLPDELSGGQQQRVALARALVTDPDLLILDEPFTALDEEAELALVKLLMELRSNRSTAYMVITHDMRLVAQLTDRVAVMAEGRIVESGAAEETITRPREDITRRLVAAAFDP